MEERLVYRVLIVDDEPDFIERVKRLLGDGFEFDAAEDWAAAKRMMGRKVFDVILLDWDLKGGPDGTSIIEKLRKTGQLSLSVILISKFMREDLRRTGYEKGADYCMTKALDDDEMRLQISNAVKRNVEKRQLIKEAVERREGMIVPVFRSRAMQDMLSSLAEYIKTSVNILITGERGTGKGVLARWIHSKSSRSDMILSHIHIPNMTKELMNSELFGHQKGAFAGAHMTMPGHLELSHRGTLILDEISELPISEQGKFLKVLQEKTFKRVRGGRELPFDVRFISLSNHRDLDQQVRDGAFRGDLLDRLRPCHIIVPPLRERKEDIPEIAEDMLHRFRVEYNRLDIEGFDDALLSKMQEYDWPGNVRELEIWISSGVLNSYGSLINVDDVEKSVDTARAGAGLPFGGEWYSGTLEDSTDFAQKVLVEHSLRQAGGNISRTAAKLGINRVNLYKVCKRLGIDYKKFRNK